MGGGAACVAGACMARGHVWQGGMHGGGCTWQRAFVAGGHAWHTCPQQILQDTVNEREVRILLECILVVSVFASVKRTFWLARLGSAYY